MRNVFKRTLKKTLKDHTDSTDVALSSGKTDESNNAEMNTVGEGVTAESEDEDTMVKKVKVNNTIVSPVQCRHFSLSNYLQHPFKYMHNFVDNHA